MSRPIRFFIVSLMYNNRFWMICASTCPSGLEQYSETPSVGDREQGLKKKWFSGSSCSHVLIFPPILSCHSYIASVLELPHTMISDIHMPWVIAPVCDWWWILSFDFYKNNLLPLIFAFRLENLSFAFFLLSGPCWQSNIHTRNSIQLSYKEFHQVELCHL